MRFLSVKMEKVMQDALKMNGKYKKLLSLLIATGESVST
jgi:hypothetical protein